MINVCGVRETYLMGARSCCLAFHVFDRHRSADGHEWMGERATESDSVTVSRAELRKMAQSVRNASTYEDRKTISERLDNMTGGLTVAPKSDGTEMLMPMIFAGFVGVLFGPQIIAYEAKRTAEKQKAKDHDARQAKTRKRATKPKKKRRSTADHPMPSRKANP